MEYDAKKARRFDASWSQDVFVVPPPFKMIDGCLEVAAYYITQLESITAEIEEASNFFGYLVNSQYRIAADIPGYYCCRNVNMYFYCI